jgi:hypothetical protein
MQNATDGAIILSDSGYLARGNSLYGRERLRYTLRWENRRLWL